ncbi:MAG: polysaccharide export outer membrane protein [Psychrobacter glaciei]|jgi:polysaccharide export outer membrane protein
MNKIIKYSILILVINQLLACTSNVMTQTDENMNKFTYASIDTYLIGVDDVLMVNIWKNPDLSVTVPVRPDGKISIPLVGDIVAGGKEPMKVAKEVKKALSKFVREPQVTVILTELRSHEFISRVRITGAVNTPSSIPYRQGMTVLDALLQAGGSNKFASGNNSKLYRIKDKKTIRYSVYLADILESGQLETNYKLLPGDIITVPERLF